jgi:hypothetical protein
MVAPRYDGWPVCIIRQRWTTPCFPFTDPAYSENTRRLLRAFPRGGGIAPLLAIAIASDGSAQSLKHYAKRIGCRGSRDI